MKPKIAIAIHGGAGTILRISMTPERELAFRKKLTEAVTVGYAILERGGNSLEAVHAAVTILEDDSLFNAGRGSVLNTDGMVEMDAAIMDGKTLKAGAVAGIRHVKNPITLAKSVLERTEHVMLIGEGAEKFAAEVGVELVEESYFITEERKRALQKAKAQQSLSEKDEHGTVGAVALDIYGNMAAATSTGGMTNKKYGRVGDTPIIGAGTYADNETCAISATGHGEHFIRSVVGHNIASLMRYNNRTLQDAAQEVVMNVLVKNGGSGGLIGIDKFGNITMPFNTEGMYRASISQGRKLIVSIYKDDE